MVSIQNIVMYRTRTRKNSRRRRSTAASAMVACNFVVVAVVVVVVVVVGISLTPVRAFAATSSTSYHTTTWTARTEKSRHDCMYHPMLETTNQIGRRQVARSGSRRIRRFASVPDKVDADEKRAGVLVLLTVPLAWGTFEPAVRYVYDIQPNVPPFLFQFVYYLIATSSLAIVLSLFPGGTQAPIQEDKPTSVNTTTNSSPMDVFSSGSGSAGDALSLWGGFELGTYLFLGNALQVVGLKTISSDRAAFLLQLTTIFVPLVQSFVALNFDVLPARTWLACFMALAGVAFIGLDGGSSSEGLLDADNDIVMSRLLSPMDNFSFSQGDVSIILAALFYTFHCLRLETYAKNSPAIKLAVAKASTETLWCGVVIVASLLASAATADSSPDPSNQLWEMAVASGNNIVEYKDAFWESVHDPAISSDEWFKLGAATTWIGLITVGYTISAQTFGQARVPPATANLIYTIQPLFTAVVAFLVLGELLGPTGYAGGLLIGSAVLLVIQNDDDNDENPS